MKIWVDADACPVAIKEIIYKAAERLKIPTVFVACQYLRIPQSQYLSFVCVEKGMDAADFYIVQNLEKDHLVITADIPLASEVVNKGAIAIDPHGRLFDEHSVAEALSVRNFLHSLRETQVIGGGGPKPFQGTDKKQFAAQFEKQISILQKRKK